MREALLAAVDDLSKLPALLEYLAERGGIKPEREFRLIELLGEDLPGAVIIRPLEGLARLHEPEAKKTPLKRHTDFHWPG